MNEAYNIGFKDGASAGYKLAIEDMKLDKKPRIMKKYEGDYATLLARHNALVEAVIRLQKLDRDRPLHPVVDGLLIEARTEVDRLIGGE